MSAQLLQHTETVTFESGQQLPGLQIAYHTFGKLNTDRDNVIWVCHALTANSDVTDWWAGLFGEGNLFNPEEHYIICANIITSPYGSSNPLTINPVDNLPYYLSFPQTTIRDMVQAHQILAAHLGIDKIKVLTGGSLGGQQAMEWAIIEPGKIENLVLIATNARHSPWGIAFNEAQRLAISTDRTFFAGRPDGGSKGLKAARAMALLSYRGYEAYQTTQLDIDHAKLDDYKASSYQNYQGEKLVRRFNAYSYWYLSKAMDSHNVGRNRDGIEQALNGIKAKTLVIGITSDFLFPTHEQQFLARHIPGAMYVEFDSPYAHDSFLIETAILTEKIGSFLNNELKVIKLETA